MRLHKCIKITMLKKMAFYMVILLTLVGVLGSNSSYADTLTETLGFVETTLAKQEETSEVLTEASTEQEETETEE